MADSVIFIGWGRAMPGREAKALELFGDSLAYWARVEQSGDIESSEVVILQAHGGDLGGFALLRGEGAKLDALQRTDDFIAISARALNLLDGFGIVGGATGDGVAQMMGAYQTALDSLS